MNWIIDIYPKSARNKSQFLFITVEFKIFYSLISIVYNNYA